MLQSGLGEWGGCSLAEIGRWHRGWGSSTHKVVGAGKTGSAWCVAWDELVDDIFREVGGVYVKRQGPRTLHLIQVPQLSLFSFLPSLQNLGTYLFYL